MPYSFTYFKPEVKEWFISNVPISYRVLDVGPGIGTYSDILRSSAKIKSLGDHLKHKYKKKR